MVAREDIGDVLAGVETLSAAALEAIENARERGWSVAACLVDGELIGEDRLADVAARAVGSMVVDLEQGELDEGCVGLIPEGLARRHLLVPIAPDDEGGRLRIAFADPLDAEAVRAVRDLTGLEVEPLVATVSAVRAAIRKAYGRDTRVMERPKELAGEATQRLRQRTDREATNGGAEASRPATAPCHRIEDEATLEQRHEALLLALIEAGAITRAAYLDALRRLLGR